MSRFRVIQHGENRFQLQIRAWFLFLPVWNDVGEWVYPNVVLYQKSLEESLKVMEKFRRNNSLYPQVVYKSDGSQRNKNGAAI